MELCAKKKRSHYTTYGLGGDNVTSKSVLKMSECISHFIGGDLYGATVSTAVRILGEWT